MISKGVTGITSRCSTVPCSRSRMRAAPVSTMESIVMPFTTSVIAPNQLFSSVGLKRTRKARSTAGAGVARTRRAYASTSPFTICWTWPLPVKAWLMRVASTLSSRPGRRPASRSRSNPGGMTRAKVSRPLSMRSSIAANGMRFGGRNMGG